MYRWQFLLLPVDDPPERRCVEVGHGRSENGVQHRPVHLLGGVQRAHGHDHGQEEQGEALDHAQTPVDTQRGQQQQGKKKKEDHRHRYKNNTPFKADIQTSTPAKSTILELTQKSNKFELSLAVYSCRCDIRRVLEAGQRQPLARLPIQE